jgi:tRNA-dihydrouridine synthase
MIGRAAIGNPWIFAGSQREEQSNDELFRMISHHLNLMTTHYQEKIGVVLFRKHMTRYLLGTFTVRTCGEKFIPSKKKTPCLRQSMNCSIQII